MTAPDEFSYLLLAKSVAAGEGLRVAPHWADRDTFYPPGLPLILAGWGKGFGFDIFTLHVCVTLLLCASVPLVYLVARRMAGGQGWVGLGIAALYATSWYTLETGLFVFSEPAFICVTMAWLYLALRWPRWWGCGWQAGVMGALALMAYAIRGAGLVCVAATVGYPLLAWGWGWYRGRTTLPGRKVAISLAVLALLLGGYMGMAARYLPKAPNSYGHQLARGINDGGRIAWWDVGRLGYHVGHLAATHFEDWAEGLVPPYRGSPRTGFYNVLAKLLLLLAVAGYLHRCVNGGGGIAELYVAFYIALYALWPFNMTRFWVPIYPLMLGYAVLALREYGARAWARRYAVSPWAPALGGLLLVLHVQELVWQFPFYQRRLNYVSACLADTAGYIRRISPEPERTIVAVPGADEEFIFAWYLGYRPRSPLAEARQVNGVWRDQRIEDHLLAMMQEAAAQPGTRLFFVTYFTHSPLTDDLCKAVMENLHREHPELIGPVAPNPNARTASGGTVGSPGPAGWTVRRVYQREIITAVWELVQDGATSRQRTESTATIPK